MAVWINQTNHLKDQTYQNSPQAKINNLNKEIDLIVKILPKKKTPGPANFTVEFCYAFKKIRGPFSIHFMSHHYSDIRSKQREYQKRELESNMVKEQYITPSGVYLRERKDGSTLENQC